MPIARDIQETPSQPDFKAAHPRHPPPPQNDRAGTLSAQLSNRTFLPHDVSGDSRSDQPAGSQDRQQLIAKIKHDRRYSLNQSLHLNSTSAFPSFPPAVEPKSDRSPNSIAEHQAFPQQCSPIERPRSALHAGDFREQTSLPLEVPESRPTYSRPGTTWTSTSPTDPWYTPSLPLSGLSPAFEPLGGQSIYPVPAEARSRSASQSSLSSSFVYRPPTSPLARGPETNDLDDRARSRSPSKSSRRRTFSPRAFRGIQQPSSPTFSSGLFGGRYITPGRRDGANPQRAHQSHRSVIIIPTLQVSATMPPHTPRSRRQSLLSDGSPLQAPMVGGYEESILRGRMSTLPSRPLDFVAQIGVLGKGRCKSSLRCPPHVSIPFPAVFYNYGSLPVHGPTSSQGPSPYVGLINLQTLQNRQDPPSATKDYSRARTSNSDGDSNTEDLDTPSRNKHMKPSSDRICSQRRQHISSVSKKAPVGGYRIPQCGQLQIVIKNPNKTAVKLFLIPYDLEGMGPGQKTFIRQRSYSAGPIIDMPLSCRKNLGTDRPEAAMTSSVDPRDRPVLRYLIHIHICCASRGRFYLYNSIRVVFANRVPDGKEKLRNEIQLPEPRYTTYKPEADVLAKASNSEDASDMSSRPIAAERFDTIPNANLDFGYSLNSKLHFAKHVDLEQQLKGGLDFPKRPMSRATNDNSPNDSTSSEQSKESRMDCSDDIGWHPSFGKAARTFGRDSSGDPGSLSPLSGAAEDSIRAREQSKSPRNGLLSLQLRELKENSESESHKEDAVTSLHLP